MREGLPRRGLTPGPESLTLSPEQQRVADKLVGPDQLVDADSIVLAADVLITPDRYRAVFEDIRHSFSDPALTPFDKVVWGSFLAANQIILSHHRADQSPNDLFDVLAKDRLASIAIASHQAFRNMPLPRIHQEFRREVDIARATIRSSFDLNLPLATFMGYLRSLEEAKFNQQFLSEIPTNDRKEARFVDRLSASNDELFGRLRRLQRYGIKSAYISDSSCLEVADWHVYDVRRLSQSLGNSLGNVVCPIRQSLARFNGFKKPLADQSPDWSKQMDAATDQEFVIVDYKSSINGRLENIAPSICFDIWPDGHLYSNSGVGLADFAKQVGLGVQYEMLRARALSLYADLVVPYYVVDESEDIQRAESKASKDAKAKTSSFGEIVLARIRTIDQRPDLPQLIAKEAKKPQPVRRHSVIGFLRTLPPGQRASQKQRDLCWQDQRIKLSETGQTYVRPQVRGGEKKNSEVEMTTHRARLRYIGEVVLDSLLGESSPEPDQDQDLQLVLPQTP